VTADGILDRHPLFASLLLSKTLRVPFLHFLGGGAVAYAAGLPHAEAVDDERARDRCAGDAARDGRVDAAGLVHAEATEAAEERGVLIDPVEAHAADARGAGLDAPGLLVV